MYKENRTNLFVLCNTYKIISKYGLHDVGIKFKKKMISILMNYIIREINLNFCKRCTFDKTGIYNK